MLNPNYLLKYRPNTRSCISAIFISLIIIIIPATQVKAQSYPSGFNQVLVANGISNPTTMAFAPDGRIFVAQQNGALRVIKNGALLSTPFLTLSVNSSGERGLLGIAFDPAFTTNNYIYLYYTLSSGANNRISRFTANGDVAFAGSEVVVLNLDQLSSATNHNGGTMQFGIDGKLYIGVGENANTAYAQNLDTYHGKILRINPDGSAPAGNPFTSGTAQRQRVWSYGMRNPYTLSIQPGTGRVFVNDVGQNTWEEVNDCTTGGLNYGWPGAEGNSTNTAFKNPIYAYQHGNSIGTGCAITGGTFFNPASTNYPSQYIGRYFFHDFCNNWIDMLTLSESTATRSNFASSIASSSVSIMTGPDGNLYFLSRSNSAVFKITYTGSTAPVITTHPQNTTVSEGNPASFSVTATDTAPLSYQWRKNGTNITGANSSTYTISSATSADAATYSVIVSNSSGSATSNDATLTVTIANSLPNATINTPVAGSNYAGGEVINFSGSGTDPEDGNLPASAFRWYSEFHHDSHSHPGPTVPSGVTSGSFTIPTDGETSANVFYRLFLEVTDSKGAKKNTYTDILPRKSNISLNTNPQGLQVTIDGQPVTAPVTISSVEGINRAIGVVSPQSNYTFSNWSHGGAATQTFVTPVDDVTYTANYSSTASTSTLSPVADAHVAGGKNSKKNFGSSTSLITQKNSSPQNNYEVFIKFDISSFNSEVYSAKLRLYGSLSNSKNSSVPVEVYNVNNIAWSESTITWENKPAADPTMLSTATISGTTAQYREWDLSQHIKNQKNAGKTSVTLKLMNSATTSNQSVFNSKESAGNKPQLVVTHTVSSTAQIKQADDNVNAGEPLNISIYPNPASKEFTIVLNGFSGNSVIKVHDVNGKLVKEHSVSNTTTQVITTDGLKNGMYIVTVQNKKAIISKKIFIEK